MAVLNIDLVARSASFAIGPSSRHICHCRAPEAARGTASAGWGIDPAAVKKRNKASKEAAHVPQSLNLFEPIARAWHANRVCELDPAHAARVMSRRERDVFPSLGQRDITTITAPEILAVVRKVEARGALDISRRMKQGIGQVFPLRDRERLGDPRSHVRHQRCAEAETTRQAHAEGAARRAAGACRRDPGL